MPRTTQVTTTLQDVQGMLGHFISDRTIIVGHSLDTDLKVVAKRRGNCCALICAAVRASQITQ
jgi:hypothetical protein